MRSRAWDAVAAGLREPQLQEQSALYKRRENLDLIAAWAPARVRAVLNALRRRLGRIHAERCYSVREVRAALAGQPVAVTDVTAIYHVPFPVNFLAKQAEKVLGARVQGSIHALVRAFESLGALPTRFLTGRYIALRIVKDR